MAFCGGPAGSTKRPEALRNSAKSSGEAAWKKRLVAAWPFFRFFIQKKTGGFFLEGFCWVSSKTFGRFFLGFQQKTGVCS